MSFSKSFTAKKMTELETINQPIIVEEMIVAFEKHEGTFGEFYPKNSPADKTLERLIKHISMIIEIANKFHISKHYTSKNNVLRVNQDALNRVTRVLLNEYAFYTRQPLTIKEFSILLNKIETIASQQHNNVHLMLGTFPIMGENNRLLNLGLYVECGNEVRLHTFAKSHASIGTEYKGYIDFDRKASRATMDEPIMASIPTAFQNTAPLESIFTCTTEGGARFIVAIDICLDHSKSHSKIAFENLLTTPNNSLLPTQISQIIISNSSELYSDKLITACVSHADAKSIVVKVDDNNCDSMELKDMSFKEITKSYIDDKGLSPSIDVAHNEIKVTNPAFGTNFVFRVYELPLSQPNNKLYKNAELQIQQANNNYIQEKIKNIYLHNSPQDLQYQFFQAVQYGELHIVEKFLKRGTDINFPDEKNRSPLHLAVQFRQADMVDWLLKNKANPEIVDEDNHSLLYRAAVQTDMKTLAILLRANVPWDKKEMNEAKISVHSLITAAIKSGDETALNELLDLYAQQNENMNAFDKKSQPLLHLAVATGKESIISALLKRSEIDVNQADQQGKSPLLRAIELKNITTINLLLDSKADINAEPSSLKKIIPNKKVTFQEIRNRPIFAAITSEGKESVNALISREDKIDLNKPDSEHGITPLLYALNLLVDKAIQPHCSSVELGSILSMVNSLLSKKAFLLGDMNTSKQDTAYITLLERGVKALNKKIQVASKDQKLSGMMASIKNICEHSMHMFVLETAVRNNDSGEINEIIQSYQEQYKDDKTKQFLDETYAVCKHKYSTSKDTIALLQPRKNLMNHR